jgi:hypothetical protein
VEGVEAKEKVNDQTNITFKRVKKEGWRRGGRGGGKESKKIKKGKKKDDAGKNGNETTIRSCLFCSVALLARRRDLLMDKLWKESCGVKEMER